MKHYLHSYIYAVLLFFMIGLLPGCGGKKKNIHVPKKAKHLPTDQQLLEKEKSELRAKAAKYMTLDELHKAKAYAVHDGDKALAVTYLQQIITKSSDQKELREARLELADMTFDLGNMEKAAEYYSHYVLLYPGSNEREYAEYKAILCRFYVMLSADRDQTKTHEALELAVAYLAKGEVNRAFVKEVEDMKIQCQQRLFETEQYVFEHHVKSGNIIGAKARLKYMREQFTEILSVVEPQIIVLECSLAEREGNDELVAKKKAELKKKYPDVAPTYLAQMRRSKLADYVMRF